MTYKKLTNFAGWLVFAIAAIVYFFSAERTGSLWDSGEFILGAYKLQVVHPPGAPLFLLVGRMFTVVAEMVSDDLQDIAFSINLMSSLCSAFAAMFICWVTILLSKLALVGREGEPDAGQNLALFGAGLVAGLSTAFATSVWFSAVEGEVYAMSTFFTTLTLWAGIKWYSLPDTPKNDRWLVFTMYAAGLSIGIHLLSILTFPALAIFYYFKKYREHTFGGIILAGLAGVVALGAVQVLIITGIPKLWSQMELMLVNGLGLPFHSGLIPVILIIGGLLFAGLHYAHQQNKGQLQMLLVSFAMIIVGFSNIGIIMVRANANTPINMNEPSDAMRLLPYLNREQYGERPLLYGPWYGAQPYDNTFEDRYGRVGDRYEIVDEKVSYKYRDSDKMFFPRMGDNTQNRAGLYQLWRNGQIGKPNFVENIGFLIRYQLGWMYMRYFHWNFTGRQNGEQGMYDGDPKSGHALTGIKFIDEARLYNQDQIPDSMRDDEARNTYFAIPLLLGLAGLFFHFYRRRDDALAVLALFVITGIGIIIYSNQPPGEPRERDYVLVGSIFTFCIWIGMAVPLLFSLLRDRANLTGPVSAGLATLLALSAPVLMGTQNFDDHSRMLHTASRDYAANFLESCAPNAIIFTYGDNDTYPLWYAQEVEEIRTDVRVVNLSLIAVDWYIDQLRRKVNDSPAIKMTIPSEALRGSNRNTVPYFNRRQTGTYNPNLDEFLDVNNVLNFIGQDQVKDTGNRRQPKSFLPTRRMYIPIDRSKARELNLVLPSDTAIVDQIPVIINKDKNYLIKDELAVLDVIASNINERPIYFAVTCRPEKMYNLFDYMQLEGLGLRIIPVKTPMSPERGQYGQVYGAGRVATDIVYENVMEEFRWGNFDKYDLFIDRSYAPSIQSLHLVMLRTAETMLAEGDKAKALDICKKYLEAFPHMNFPYDYRTLRILSVMVEAGGYEEAKPHLELLAMETLQYLEFYDSLSEENLAAGFESDFRLTLQTKEGLIRTVQRSGDKEFEEALIAEFKPWELPPRPQNNVPNIDDEIIE